SRPEEERSPERAASWAGIEELGSEDKNNYPLTVSVDDLGEGFAMTAQVVRPMEAARICEYLRVALEQLVEALEKAPWRPMRSLDVLPVAERDQLLAEWNETKASYPWDRRIQELFEQQVGKTSEAIALVYENRQLSYAELNQRANLLAHHLK